MSEEITPQEPEQKQSTDYFENIPKWSNDSTAKRFEVMSDGISGRIPVTRIERWQDFATMLEDTFFNRPKVNLVFRGHRRHDWELTPTLGRLSVNGIITEELANKQLSKFRKAIRGRVLDRGLLEQDEDWQNDELWSVGQHHGLMTPLLDWTNSPFVGLFFAFAKEDVMGEKDNPYRVLYVLNKSFVEDDSICPDIRVIEPKKDDHGRLVNQAGLFTFSPFDSTIENKLADILADTEFEDDELREAAEEDQPDLLAKYLCKIYIKNEGRDECLKHLRRMNVHHASLFPDLIGASDYCNILTAEEEKEKTLARHKKEKEREAEEKVGLSISLTKADYKPASATELIESILKHPKEASELELELIGAAAEELNKALSKEMVVDWTDRESVQARMRIQIKFVLRKYEYPTGIREEVADEIVNRLIKLENKKDVITN